jgi:hypothetical protein
MLGLKIELRGVQAAQNLWQLLIARLRFNSGGSDNPLTKIAEDFYATERAWFDSEGGGRWRPLSPRYAAWKKQTYPGKKILQRRGRMYAEFTGQTRRFRVMNKRLIINARGVDYWIKHEYGDPSTRLPKRPVLSPFLRQRVTAWHDLVTTYLVVLKGRKAAALRAPGVSSTTGTR